jgi:ParB family transcriptional regulator, chromosome partitioning protein
MDKKTTVKSVNLRDIAEGTGTYLKLDPRKIQVKEGFNVRQDMGNMAELIASIETKGVIVPMRIFTEGANIYLSDGHRRLEAVRQLIAKGVEIKSVPCISEEKGIGIESLTARILSYNDGKPLTPLEEAHAIMRLFNYGWTTEQIQHETGRSQAHISNAKVLVNLPKEVQKEIHNEIIAPSFALELSRECGDDKEKLIKTVKEAKETAAALGRKKITKKIAKKGTTKNTSKKAERNKIVELLKDSIKAIRNEKDIDKGDIIERLESYIQTLVGGAQTAKA